MECLMFSRYNSIVMEGVISFHSYTKNAPVFHGLLFIFFQLFNTCIENSEKTDDLDKRLDILLNNCTNTVYVNVARYVTNWLKITVNVERLDHCIVKVTEQACYNFQRFV